VPQLGADLLGHADAVAGVVLAAVEVGRCDGEELALERLVALEATRREDDPAPHPDVAVPRSDAGHRAVRSGQQGGGRGVVADLDVAVEHQ
jgi:hypothetical protein